MRQVKDILTDDEYKTFVGLLAKIATASGERLVRFNTDFMSVEFE